MNEKEGLAMMYKIYNNRIYKNGYRPEYCEMLIKHSEEGGNFGEFAAKINVNRHTLMIWTKQYPEFKKAKKIAELKCEAYWQELNRNLSQRRFNYTEFLFMMVGIFGYKNPKRTPKKE